MKSALKEFLFAIDLSTQASPSTLRRWVMPSSRRFWSSIDPSPKLVLARIASQSDP
jgi:hypothetical protein